MDGDKYLLYIGTDVGRENTAMYVHGQNIAKIFLQLGYTPIFISELGAPDDKVNETAVLKDSSLYYYAGKRRTSRNVIIDKYYIFCDYLKGRLLWERFLKVSKEKEPDIIVQYGAPALEHRMIKYSEEHGIPLFIDRTDWFDRSERQGIAGKLWTSPMVDYAIKHLDFHASGVIAISDFFYKHYKNKVPVIWIPALSDASRKTPIVNGKHEPLRISYAGVPNAKENIWPFVEAVCAVNQERPRVRLDLVGIERATAEQYLKPRDWNSLGVYCHGVIPHEEAVDVLESSDVSLLLRLKKRSTIAGFSTKFAESMRLGVPVLCSRVGGADVCVEDMKTGFLIDDTSMESCMNGLKKLLSLSDEELFQIKQNAYNYAKDNFAYQSYVEPMQHLITETMKRTHFDGIKYNVKEEKKNGTTT